MKVKQLITLLKQLKPNADIYLSSDGEGNSYSNPSDICADEKEKYYILFPDDSYLDIEELG